MSNVIRIHPQDPQHRLIKQVVKVLDKGDVIAYPTDSGYALGCTLGNKSAMEKIRDIRKLSKHHHFTLMMKDLSHVGEYAKLNNSAFRLMKKFLPGAYTFILEGAREVPNRLLHEKRKTIGIRISNHPIVRAILDELTEPMMSVSLVIKGYEFYNYNDVQAVLNSSVSLVIDAGHCPPEPTTVIDLSGNEILILRKGAGSLDLIN